MKNILVAASLGALTSFLTSIPASAETTQCIEIMAVPVTISTPGVHCFKKVISTAMASGNAITVNANNVTIDFNDFELDGLGAGPNTEAIAVYALNRRNLTIRNARIRGFRQGIAIEETENSNLSAGHLIEDSSFEGNTYKGIHVAGFGVTIRRNRITDTDSTPPAAPAGTISSGGSTTTASSGASTRPSAQARTSRNAGLNKISNKTIPQLGNGSQTAGIFADLLRNSQIIDNLILRTISSASESRAISVKRASNVEVARNRIQNTTARTYASGIYIEATTPGFAVVVKDNVILSGTSELNTAIGIETSSGFTLCMNNTVTDFANSSTFGCDQEAGTFPTPS